MTVECYVDVLCPWCYIGRRRLAAALAGLDGVEVRWRSYELGPALGRTPGRTAAEEMADPSWWGADGPARVERIRQLGAAEGLELNLHRARPVNTFDAHRLLQLATAEDRADAMLERLLHAYHTDGRDIADAEVLASLGAAAGLPGDRVRAVLAGDAFAGAVRADERRAAAQGVTGVPTLVIDGGPPVPGVQPPAALRRLLERA